MSLRRARDLEHVYRSGRTREHLRRYGGRPSAIDAATYAQQIKNKKAIARKTAPRPAAKASPAARKPELSAAPKPEPAAAQAAAPPGELQGLKDELQRVNQGISKIARIGGPDAARQSSLPEKQELLRRKVDLERKIRAVRM